MNRIEVEGPGSGNKPHRGGKAPSRFLLASGLLPSLFSPGVWDLRSVISPETEGECGPTTTQVFLQCSLGEASRQPKPRSVRLTVAVATGAWWGEPDSPVLGIVP